MRRTIPTAVLGLAISIVLPASALAAAGGSDLPLKGTFSGTTAHNLSTWNLEGVSAGQVAHLGRTVIDQIATLQPTSPITFVWSGTWKMTAANGDQISGTAAGNCSRANPTAIEVTCGVDYVSTAGTGRFTNASAHFTATMHSVRVALDPGPPVISYGEHEGRLTGHLSW